MCRHFTEDFNLDTRIVRYHNIFGPLGTYDGGREKAPAALCRKIINAKINKKKILKFGVMANRQEVFYILKIV